MISGRADDDAINGDKVVIGEIEHITVTSGASRMSSRDEVVDRVVDDLRTALADHGGAVVGSRWKVVLLPSPEGCHVYDLNYNGVHIVRCWLCLDRAHEANMWASAAASSMDPRVRLHPPRRRPWLAVALTPDAVLRAPREALMDAGDLERCVAWALME